MWLLLKGPTGLWDSPGQWSNTVFKSPRGNMTRASCFEHPPWTKKMAHCVRYSIIGNFDKCFRDKGCWEKCPKVSGTPMKMAKPTNPDTLTSYCRLNSKLDLASWQVGHSNSSKAWRIFFNVEINNPWLCICIQSPKLKYIIATSPAIKYSLWMTPPYRC